MHVLSIQEHRGIKCPSRQKCRSRHTMIDFGVLPCHCSNDYSEIKITHVTDKIFLYVNVIGNFFWNIVVPMINWKTGISMMILLFAAVLHYYSISDMLLRSGNVMMTDVSNTMLEQTKSVMIDMLKFPEQSKSQILECAQIQNYPFRTYGCSCGSS